MAVKILMSLEGVDQVTAGFAEAQKAGEDMMKSITGLSDQDPLKGFSLSIGGATQAMDQHGKSVNVVTEAYHILNPILRTAGVSFTELRALSILARGGIEGIGAAVVGTALVAFSELSQTVEDNRRRLTDFFGSAQTGGAVFEQLSASAAKFGTSVKAMLPGVEGFVTSWNDFVEKNRTFKFVAIDPANLPSAENILRVVQAFNTFKEILLANNATVADADKALAQFNAELDKTGTVTGTMVKQLLAVAPGALALLEQALGKTGLSAAALEKQLDQVPVPMDKLVQGLDRIKPAVDAAFDVRPVQSFIENLKANFGSLSESLSRVADQINQIKETPLTLAAPGEGALPTFDNIVKAFEATTAQLKQDATQAGVDVNTGINQGLTQNPPDFSPILNAFQQTGSQLVSMAQTIWDNIKSILSNPINIPTALPTGFASGGLVSGPGTSTSDSILAMLSNREFVVNARSTEFYGPGFLAALNAMLVPRNLLPGFASGGMVRAIADGGQQSRTPVNLIIDRQSFAMSATDDVVKALGQFSVNEQLAQAGRSPGWRRS